MDRLWIKGGVPLTGDIEISGAKNAALPLMVASLLSEEPLILSNLPHLADIAQMAKILAQHGVEVGMAGHGAQGAAHGRVISLDGGTITSTTAPYDLVRKMRASFLVAGPLLGRFGKAKVSLPGGCAIGTRPVDLHLQGLEALGAKIELEDGYVIAEAPGGLKGAEFRFPLVSVGATENLLMAATLASGVTVLDNAAREPEITDLADCLIAMGADIEGAGTERITIRGQKKLHGAEHPVIADRIEAGTFAIAVGLTGGMVHLRGARRDHLEALITVLEQAGLTIEDTQIGLKVSRPANRAKAVEVTTEPFPGFPTDLQAQLMALMCVAEGTSTVRETIFENRYMHVPELVRMGAKISVHGDVASVEGTARLKGAPVMATDLRASVSLILAGLAAEGETVVNRVYHLDRGFERIEEKLGACGAQIRRLKD